ncbi:tripartite tricarboxylate transporter permease [Nitratireductor mangrovi]|uniref:tripartite tricarboxylate transporter permease n=1 Tax=Nitratireductor mangrovi TaxID=2599600 RepID=UPI001FEEF2D7|nr:tripartite tricarboxylate transporter permease [Nitratireductor mangrovi]
MLTEFSTFALEVLTSPTLLGLGVCATLLGIILGALPGISSTMTLAVLLPFSFSMSPHVAMIFLIGAFYGSVYGGSISAILINIPGTPGSMVTQLDGYPMARRGDAGQALTYALVASTIGGLFGIVGLMLFAPILAKAAFAFQSPEYAVIMVFGLSMLAYASPGSTYLGIMSGILGLVLGMVGLDVVTNLSRFDFGIHRLQGGINIIPFAVGIFGLAEVLRLLEKPLDSDRSASRIANLWPSFGQIAAKFGTAIRSSTIGLLVGIIPAAGSAVAVSISYAQEKKLFGRRETFGDGNPRGIVAAEAGNNACVGGALIPLITLGIPGDTMTAVLIGALLVHGLRPGPDLFVEHPDFIASIYVALTLTVLVTFLLALPLMRVFARLLSVPPRILLVGVLILCVTGSYAVQNSLFDVLLMIFFGCVGYLLAKFGVPTAPVMFGLVLGPVLEENLRRTMIVYGDWSVFLTRPICALMLAVTAIIIFFPLIAGLRRRITRTQNA